MIYRLADNSLLNNKCRPSDNYTFDVFLKIKDDEGSRDVLKTYIAWCSNEHTDYLSKCVWVELDPLNESLR